MAQDETVLQPDVTRIAHEAVLDVGDYFQLRAYLRDVQVAQQEATALVQRAVTVRDTCYAVLAEKYALPLKPTRIDWRDDTRTIVVAED